jgi:peptide/nickel transport system ATP-binding protein
MLRIDELSVEFETKRGTAYVLDRVSFDISPGEVVGLVGESGSGKSVLSYAVSGLLDPAARITHGAILWQGQPIEVQREKRRPKVPVAQIFQNPRASLNPTRTVGWQIADVAGSQRVAELLQSVRLPAEKALSYPSELSGGQCQRIGIALALGCEPELLIADEPTTGLDVITEAAILNLIGDLSRARRMATLLVTHDLALAASRCDRIVVMHAGQVVEIAPSEVIVQAARHPYAAKLRACVPQFNEDAASLSVIPGQLPDLTGALPVCRFSARCVRHTDDCETSPLPVVQVAEDHIVSCRHPLC